MWVACPEQEIPIRDAHTPEAKEKRKATIERRRQAQREDVVLLRRRGLVPLAIAGVVGMPVSKVTRILEDEGFELPSYLTLSGPRPKRDRCPKCGTAR